MLLRIIAVADGLHCEPDQRRDDHQWEEGFPESLRAHRTPRRPRAPCRSGRAAAEGQAARPPSTEAEPLLPPVRDPDVAVAGSRELLAHFLQRRLRVREIPDQNADDAQPGRGSFAISALTSRSTSASSCPKSSRYECSAAWITRRSSSESSIVCMTRTAPLARSFRGVRRLRSSSYLPA